MQKKLTYLRGTIKPAHKVRCNFIFTRKHGIAEITKLQNILCLIYLKQQNKILFFKSKDEKLFEIANVKLIEIATNHKVS